MIQKVNVPISVITVFDHRDRTSQILRVLYEGQEHKIVKAGFHHTYREGRTLFHVFSVSSTSMFFRLVYNTENLSWLLTEIHDGEVN